MSNLGFNLPADFGWPGDAPVPMDEVLPIYGPPLLKRMVGFFQGDPLEDQQIVAPAAAIGLTVPAMANSCLVTTEGASIRVRFGKGNPTAALGHLFIAGSIFVITGKTTMQEVTMIQTAAAATVMVTYFS